ncbi:PAS domain S-box protein [Nostocaceae cyanobacterium CENA357]|uniref:histidine kinase n=1 Tax=Atlanticothrix silvestris CENA357 TaxID=1725252 RepID=A0A8J7HLM3_9CYAN|nr:PAS domain-containing sensor histidine kinase [Atlanticothrix silvestris]MBH8554715.1 PAS domain S-box protein [Atlanticothrix silvestris CENA357]
MAGDNLEQAIAGAHRRLENLSRRASQTQRQDFAVELLQEAITEISISLEELHVSAEELQQQNEELAATRQLVEAERQRYQDLFNFAPDAYLVTDVTGIIQEANYAAVQLLNVRQGALIGKPFSVFVYQAERHKFRLMMLRLRQQKQIRGQELWMFHNNGDIDFPAEVTATLTGGDSKGKPDSLRWLLRDISDRYRTEQKIREQAALLDITTDAILVRNLDNQVLFWNKGAENVYGWRTEEILGKNASILLPQTSPKTSPQLAAIIKIVSELGSWQGELYKVTKDGKKLVIASRWTLMRDPAGLPKSILTVDTDITEKKQLETRLFRTQRLESLGTLASGIAHDLNNILTPMVTIAQLLPLKHLQMDENSQQMLKLLETNAKRGSDLIQQILSFTHSSEGKRTIVSVSQIIEDIEQMIKRTFPQFIDIYTDISPDVGIVLGDSTQLHQVLMNLVVNARDAMPNGGSLRISATKLSLNQNHHKIRIGAKTGSYIVITVSDTGVGICPEIIDRIFDPFFTTKEVGKGTGLGLSTVIGIINNHGGFVDVSSEIEVGSQFQVYLPSSEESIDSVVDEIELPIGQGELILVVDDEAAITQITKTTLEIHNYRVLTAENGIEALALYTLHKNEIQLVLMDMMMPSMAGGTAIRTLQIMNREVQIIAMSGLASAEALTQFTGGIQGFLPKPFTVHELLNSVQQVLTSGSKSFH